MHKHDGVALAELVRAKKVTAKELCAQAAEAVPRIDPQIEAVLGLYEDVVADPDRNGPSKGGLFYGVPILLKDLGSGLAGRKQESGSKLFKDHTVEATDPLIDDYLSAGLIPSGDRRLPNSA
jgi:amidase